MDWSFLFFLNSALLGIGLAMDAFSASLANGLNEPTMSKKKMLFVSGIFSLFQGLMPMIGWICVHTFVKYFKAFEKAIPWIALILLVFIGSSMLIESIKNKNKEIEKTNVGIIALLIQGVATSIDALSVGFTIAEYELIMAIVCALIITLITFVICFIGIIIGKKFGTKFGNKATIFGGIILIIIGIEIFITGIL